MLSLRYSPSWLRRVSAVAAAVSIPALLGPAGQAQGPGVQVGASLSAPHTWSGLVQSQVGSDAVRAPQGTGRVPGTPVKGTSPFAVLQDLAFKKALHATRVVRLYESVKGGNKRTGLKEEIYLQPATATTPLRFALMLVGVEGTQLDEQQLAERRRRYDSHASFLLFHRDFNVRDAELAARNYTVQVKSVVEGRKNRDIYSIVPILAGRTSFEVRVDTDVGVIVGHREFDSSNRLVLEWQYETLEVGSSVQFPEDRAQWYWTPIRPVTVHPDVQAAALVVTSQFKPRIPDRTQVPQGFNLMEIRTTYEPFTNKHYLVLDYTDGISSLFLVESAATEPDLFGAANVAGVESEGPTIYRHVAAGHSQCWARKDNLHLLVVSRIIDRQIPEFLATMLR
jgi:hypothetical protein